MSTSDKALPTPAEFERQLAHFINGTLLGGSGAVDCCPKQQDASASTKSLLTICMAAHSSRRAAVATKRSRFEKQQSQGTGGKNPPEKAQSKGQVENSPT